MLFDTLIQKSISDDSFPALTEVGILRKADKWITKSDWPMDEELTTSMSTKELLSSMVCFPAYGIHLLSVHKFRVFIFLNCNTFWWVMAG